MSFDTTPKPFFLQAMRNQSWNATGAIAELVDNSFGPGRGNASLCEITYDARKGYIQIIDNGAGMPSIGRLFQLGNTIGRSPGDIGMYGSGGTMAIMWLASDASVYTLRDGMVAHDVVVWSACIDGDRFPIIDDSWRRASAANCPPRLLEHGQGTAIVLKLAKERGRLNASNIRRDLAKIYGPGIRAGKHIVWTTIGRGGETETLTDPMPIPSAGDQVVEIDITIEYGDEYLPVTGKVALIDGLKQIDSGIGVGYGSRVIAKTKDCFASPDGDETFIGSSVIGWLDLGDGWQPYLSTTKDALNDRPLWNLLMGYVFVKIRPLLEASDDEKLTLELEHIALSLRSLFDGHATVTVAKKPVELLIDEGDGRGDVEEPKPDTPKEIPEDDDADHERQAPARTEIQIEPISDDAIDGVLCRANKIGDTIAVVVNKDHTIIDTALTQKPVNRILLTHVVVAEIANLMAADPELCVMAFKKRVATDLLDVIDEPERERKLIRLMSDNVRSKTKAVA